MDHIDTVPNQHFLSVRAALHNIRQCAHLMRD
jgi:hypothetical protein